MKKLILISLVLALSTGCSGMAFLPAPAPGCEYVLRANQAGTYFLPNAQDITESYIRAQVDPIETINRLRKK